MNFHVQAKTYKSHQVSSNVNFAIIVVRVVTKTWINITGTHNKKKFSKRKLTKLIWLIVSKRNHENHIAVVNIIVIGMANGMAKRKLPKLIYPMVLKRKNAVSTVVTIAATDSVLLIQGFMTEKQYLFHPE